MEVSHKDLELSFFQYLTLTRIRFFGISENLAWFTPRYKFLREYKLIEHSSRFPSRFVLSEKAKMYLRHKQRDRFRFWIPVVISIFALFGGYDVYTNPILEQFLQAIAKLWKTIWESLGAFF